MGEVKKSKGDQELRRVKEKKTQRERRGKNKRIVWLDFSDAEKSLPRYARFPQMYLAVSAIKTHKKIEL